MLQSVLSRGYGVLPRGLSDKESTCQFGRPGFDPWLGKIPWRRKWWPTPVFLPRESQGQRSWRLQPMGSKRVGHNLATKQQQRVYDFSCSVMSSSLWPHGLQHIRLPCFSPSPRVCSNSCPTSRWCHPTILSSVVILESPSPRNKYKD